MGIVYGKPANYKKAVSASAVRRIVNDEMRARTTTRKNKPNRRREEEPEEEPEEEMPDEFKDAMREADLDPDDPADVEKFLKSLNQNGGRKRRAKHKRK